MAETVEDLMPAYPSDEPFPNTMTWLTDLILKSRRPDNGRRQFIIRKEPAENKEAADR